MNGKVLCSADKAGRISVADLKAGIYIIPVNDAAGHLIKIEKLVKRD